MAYFDTTLVSNSQTRDASSWFGIMGILKVNKFLFHVYNPSGEYVCEITVSIPDNFTTSVATHHNMNNLNPDQTAVTFEFINKALRQDL